MLSKQKMLSAYSLILGLSTCENLFDYYDNYECCNKQSKLTDDQFDPTKNCERGSFSFYRPNSIGTTRFTPFVIDDTLIVHGVQNSFDVKDVDKIGALTIMQYKLGSNGQFGNDHPKTCVLPSDYGKYTGNIIADKDYIWLVTNDYVTNTNTLKLYRVNRNTCEHKLVKLEKYEQRARNVQQISHNSKYIFFFSPSLPGYIGNYNFYRVSKDMSENIKLIATQATLGTKKSSYFNSIPNILLGDNVIYQQSGGYGIMSNVNGPIDKIVIEKFASNYPEPGGSYSPGTSVVYEGNYGYFLSGINFGTNVLDNITLVKFDGKKNKPMFCNINLKENNFTGSYLVEALVIDSGMAYIPIYDENKNTITNLKLSTDTMKDTGNPVCNIVQRSFPDDITDLTTMTFENNSNYTSVAYMNNSLTDIAKFKNSMYGRMFSPFWSLSPSYAQKYKSNIYTGSSNILLRIDVNSLNIVEKRIPLLSGNYDARSTSSCSSLESFYQENKCCKNSNTDVDWVCSATVPLDRCKGRIDKNLFSGFETLSRSPANRCTNVKDFFTRRVQTNVCTETVNWMKDIMKTRFFIDDISHPNQKDGNVLFSELCERTCC